MNPADLDKLPYYQIKPFDNRTVVLLPFWENGEYKIPFQTPNGLVLLTAVSAYSGSYMAKEIVDPDIDISLPLLELCIQQIPSAKSIRTIQSIVHNLTNLSAALEKYDLIFHNNGDKLGAGFLISTELEYLFFSVRSLYDQLQRIIKDNWNLTSLADKNIKKKMLPDSFRDVVLKGNDDEIRTTQEIIDRFGLPELLAMFYSQQGTFFKLCRAIRDDMIHRGKSISGTPIFGLDDGFAVQTTMFPYSEFNCWKTLRNDRLGCVKALMSHVIDQIIVATSDYCSALTSCVQLPKPISHEWHIFMRHPFNGHLRNLRAYIENPWVDTGSITK